MMTWKQCGIGLVFLAGLAPTIRAQVIPAAPAPAAGAAATATAVATPATAAPTKNLWSFLCPSAEQKAACKEKFCNCALGQLINNSLKPAGALTGGIVPNLCPEVTPADLAKPADSAEGSAARIKQDEANAKARRAAVRYLGTVDCNYWPEAQKGLINALRADRNECVRFEAALALTRGCCCNKAIIMALTLTVSGSKADGNPAENSERVKSTAAIALEHCCSCFVEVEEKTQETIEPSPKVEPSPTPPSPRPEEKKTALDPTNYNTQVEKMSDKAVLDLARKALSKVLNGQPRVVQQAPIAHSFVELVAKSGPSRDASGVMESLPAEGTVVTTVPAKTRPTKDMITMESPPVDKTVVSTSKPRGLLVAGPKPSAQAYINTKPMAETASPEVVVSMPTKQMMPAPMPGKVVSVDLPKETKSVPTKEANRELDEKGRMLARLHHSPHADEREIAINRLAAMTGSGHGEVLKEIENAAIGDKAPTVRAACLRAIAKMNVKNDEVMAIVERLKTDPSPMVRHEADKTMSILTSVQSSYAPTSGIHKASAEDSLRIP
jgi:hypothetical protein